MIVRRVGLRELRTVLDIQKRSFGKVMWSTFPIVVEQIFRGGEMYVIDYKQESIGFLHFRRRGHTGKHFINLCIVDEYKGEGFAYEALRYLHREFYKRGVSEITLETSHENIHAQRLLKSLGYSETGRVPNYYKSGYFNGSDAVQMRLSLDNTII